MIPKGARLFPTNVGVKEPRPGTHGHKDAVPADQFDMDLVPRYCNYGIALDGQFLVVDIDRPEAVEGPFRELGGTWTQKTRRGTHMLYRYDGEGSNKKFAGGDIKVSGYIMGPGSLVDDHEYGVTDARDPEPAPDWLVEIVRARTVEPQGVEERNGVPAGEHDDFLYKTASWLRGRYGLSQDAIQDFLRDGPLSVLEGTKDDDPYKDADLERIARSAAGHEASTEAIGLTTVYRTGADVGTIAMPQTWILPGFIPSGVLTILYGDGKIGKSSFSSWLAARETRQGKRVIFIPSGEEPFDLFVVRARLNGAVDSLLHEYAPQNFNLTVGVPSLRGFIDSLEDVSLVYIDALYSQFGQSQGENEAVRARRNLSPLARLAEETGVTVLGTIHENKAGQQLGSTEMRNVCRSLIHAKGGKGKDFTIWSDGANGWSPDYGVTFPGHSVPILDAEGKQLVFQDLFGETIPQSVWVLELGDKTNRLTQDTDEIEETNASRIRTFLQQAPEASNPEVTLALGIPRNSVDAIAGTIRTELGIVTPRGRPKQ